MDKAISVFLLAGSAFMFFAAGLDGDAALLVLPAAGSGAAGVHLWSRGAKKSLAPSGESAQLEQQVAHVQESLESLHAEVRQLREGKDFYGELYPGSVEQNTSDSSGFRPSA
jgi:hypothetical protein